MELKENERLDSLVKTGRQIIQNENEFCFSIDAVLLAHFLSYGGRERVLDLGTGTGVIPLLIADEVRSIEAIEYNALMAEMASRSVRLNSLEAKINVKEGDYRQIEKYYERESFDIVLSNPPYRPIGRGDTSILTGVARARHELTATLDDTVRAIRYALRYRGRVAMVHLPERLEEILVSFHDHQLAAKRIQFVQPKRDKAPNMVLIEAVCGGVVGGLRVMTPLVVHNDDGSYTKEVLKYYE